MTTLTEVLSTADADSATALVQARAFKAGLYDCIIPSEWRNSALSVDDAYGVIEAV